MRLLVPITGALAAYARHYTCSTVCSHAASRNELILQHPLLTMPVQPSSKGHTKAPQATFCSLWIWITARRQTGIYLTQRQGCGSRQHSTCSTELMHTTFTLSTSGWFDESAAASPPFYLFDTITLPATLISHRTQALRGLVNHEVVVLCFCALSILSYLV